MKDLMNITPAQHKLLASALRMKILHILSGEPMTAKQVADQLGETPGNVHYHIQRLYDGELLELVETREVGGILEKYYKSVATRFHIDQAIAPPAGKKLGLVTAHLLLTQEELLALNEQLMDLLESWESRTLPDSGEPRTEFTVDCTAYTDISGSEDD